MKNTNRETVNQLIISISGQANIIAVSTIFVKAFKGDYPSALLLTQIIYWSDKTKRKDGYFYHSYKDWEDELFLSQYQVSRAVKGLKELGLVETKLIKAEGAPTLHYKIHLDAIRIFLEKHITIFNGLSRNLIMDYKETSQSMDYKETSQSLTETKTTTDIKDSTDEEPVGNAPDIPEEKPIKPKPPSKHEAVVAYKKIVDTNRNPNRVQMEAIIETVTDIPLWEKVIRYWLGHGWSSVNIDGMLDAYKKGGPPEDQWSKKGKPKAPPIPGKHPENEQSDALLNAFLESTGIARVMLDEDKAVSEINQRWIPGGVTPDDVREAAKELLEKGYSVAGPWSLTNSINAIKSKSAKSAKPDFSAYKVVQ